MGIKAEGGSGSMTVGKGLGTGVAVKSFSSFTVCNPGASREWLSQIAKFLRTM